jgi:hypothetical protein
VAAIATEKGMMPPRYLHVVDFKAAAQWLFNRTAVGIADAIGPNLLARALDRSPFPWHRRTSVGVEDAPRRGVYRNLRRRAHSIPGFLRHQHHSPLSPCGCQAKGHAPKLVLAPRQPYERGIVRGVVGCRPELAVFGLNIASASVISCAQIQWNKLVAHHSFLSTVNGRSIYSGENHRASLAIYVAGRWTFYDNVDILRSTF